MADDTARPLPNGAVLPPPPGAPPTNTQVLPAGTIGPAPASPDTRALMQQMLAAATAAQRAEYEAGEAAANQRTRDAAERHDQEAAGWSDQVQSAVDAGDYRLVITYAQRVLDSTGKADALRESIGQARPEARP